MKLTKQILRKIIREEVIKMRIEEKLEDFERLDTVHVANINKMGTVLKQYGRRVLVQFPNGTTKTFNASDLRKIENG